MKKHLKVHRVLVALLTLLVLYVGIRYYTVLTKREETFKINDTSTVILSLEDKFNKNDYWAGTFNLLWNNLHDELDLKKVNKTSSKNATIIANLEKQTFNKKYISSSSYYNKHGYATESLKQTIKKDIKKKFNTTSNVLDEFDWNGNDYFIYSMLYKEFKFKYKFEELDKDKFKNVDNVEYFGIRNSSSSKLRDQVRVLYYQDINNFAIKLLTTSDEEVILARGAQGSDFLSVYDNIQKLAESFEGNKGFSKDDVLKIPVINFHNHETIKELDGIELVTKVDNLTINKVVRDTIFKLDATGGKLKDEIAGGAFATSIDKNVRLFYFNNEFYLFLKEKNKDLPYFAMNISDISKFQDITNN